MENVLRQRRNKDVLIFLFAIILVFVGCRRVDTETAPYDLKEDILNSVKNTRPEMEFLTEVSLAEFSDIYIHVYEYEPLAIGLDKEFSVKRNSKDDELIDAVRFQFIFSHEEIKQQKKDVEKEINIILEEAAGDNSDQEKLNYIIDSITRNLVYDDVTEGSNSAYSALCKKRANCQGVSKTLVLLCSRAGIKCGYCIGTLYNYPHMWNYVYIDGSKRQLDLLEYITDIDVENRILGEMIEY